MKIQSSKKLSYTGNLGVGELRALLQNVPDEAEVTFSFQEADPPYGTSTTTITVSWSDYPSTSDTLV